jgi:hypothetical protein
LFYLTRSAPKKCFGALRIEYKDATLAATKLPKNKPQNERPLKNRRASFCGTTSDGLKQARSAFAKPCLRAVASNLLQTIALVPLLLGAAICRSLPP